MQPFLKWAGGKRKLIPQFEPYLPKIGNETYFEPFLGAGALFFYLQPKKAIVNDINSELINVYKVLQNDNIDLLIELLKEHKKKNDELQKDYFYEVRNWDRSDDFLEKRSPIERAARFIYLNKTCFNGLYRVNSKGHFNVPYGKYKNPDIVNEELLREINDYLKTNDIRFLNTDFETAVEKAQIGDFIYFDPPYVPLSETSSFTSYDKDGFGEKEQIRLKEIFTKLNDKGCKVMLSNSDTSFIREQYQRFNIVTVQAARAINSKADGRGKINEVLVLGDYYEREKDFQK